MISYFHQFRSEKFQRFGGKTKVIKANVKSIKKHYLTTQSAYNSDRVFKLGDANTQVEQMLQGDAMSGAARDIAQFDLSALYPSNTSSFSPVFIQLS